VNLNNITRRVRNFFSSEKVEWSIMLIADFQSEDMEQRMKEILNAMSGLKESKKIYFTFFLNGSLKLLKRLITIPDELKNTNEDYFYTAVFDNSSEVSQVAKHDLSKAWGMGKLFNIYKNAKPAKYKCLITWGDGSVYSFFSRKPENSIFQKNEINDFLKQVVDADAYRTFYNNFSNNGRDNSLFSKPYSKYSLSIFELKIAIEKSLGKMPPGKKQFDITFMQNCGMAYYQTLITSSFYTRNLIASASRISLDTINFSELINYVTNNTAKVSPDNFAKFIYDKSKGVFTSFTLSNYVKFKRLINDLGKNFLGLLEIESKVELIREIRNSYTELKGSLAFRIIELFELCSITLTYENQITPALKQTCKELLEFKEENKWGDVSIFFPISKDDFQGISLLTLDQLDLNTVFTKEFLDKHAWDYFIQKYINKVEVIQGYQ